MPKNTLERHQVAIYFAAVLAGLLIAALAGDASATLGRWINSALAALLYVTFLQVPLRALRKAFGQARFLAALLVANFIAVPLVVLALIQFLPDTPALQFAVLLVLLTPGIDYAVVSRTLDAGTSSSASLQPPSCSSPNCSCCPFTSGCFSGPRRPL